MREYEEACRLYGIHLMTLTAILSQLGGLATCPAFAVFVKVWNETNSLLGEGKLTREGVKRFSQALSDLLEVGGLELTRKELERLFIELQKIN